MDKTCETCKFGGTLPRSQPCCCYVPFVRDKWQPKDQPITYTRDEVLELMEYAASSRIDSLEPILDNFDEIKMQKEDGKEL